MKLHHLAVLLLAAACGRSDQRTESGGEVPAAARHGRIVIAANADVEDLNPLTLRNALAGQIAREMLFVPLLRLDSTLAPAPGLARTWEVSPDTSAITFHLRDDVRWHDGVPTTAADVKFTYDRARDARTAAINTALWADYGEMTVLDSLTVRVAVRPHADFMAPWPFFAPVPRHVLDTIPPEDTRRAAFSTTRPVGNGPFRVAGRRPGDGWEFAANEHYPAELGGRPYLDGIVLRVIPEITTATTELLTGQVQVMLGTTPEQRARVDSSGRARVLEFQTPGYTHIVWNARRPWFRDGRVRRALTLAIDRQGIIDGILYGAADLGATTVSPMLWNHDPAAGAALAHDRAAAARLLAEAGWRDRDGDGVLEDSAGLPFRFTLSGNRSSMTGEQVMEKIQADLRRVGVAAELRLEEFNTLLARMQDPASRDFDAALNTRTTGFRIDDRDSFHCSRMQGAYQTAGFCDAEVDRLLDTLPRIAGRDAAMPLWRTYQRRIAELQPYAFLYHPRSLMGISNRIQGVRPDARGALVGVARWWVQPDSARR